MKRRTSNIKSNEHNVIKTGAALRSRSLQASVFRAKKRSDKGVIYGNGKRYKASSDIRQLREPFKDRTRLCNVLNIKNTSISRHFLPGCMSSTTRVS